MRQVSLRQCFPVSYDKLQVGLNLNGRSGRGGPKSRQFEGNKIMWLELLGVQEVAVAYGGQPKPGG